MIAARGGGSVRVAMDRAVRLRCRDPGDLLASQEIDFEAAGEYVETPAAIRYSERYECYDLSP